ncbi:FtsX-like permease family protein [Nocardiopsis dassonvillei]|uniref:FtsX-like permease family protein n=1 Tax=Nocardiopsis dassonvillei TaxID=2014 RepID=UPI0036360107
MRWAAIWLLIRPARTGLAAVLLPVITFAIITTAVLSTGVVARLFWEAPDTEFGAYKLMAAVLIAVLLVPLSTLSASAARLSARRRDDRLATLRLLGASSGWVRSVAVAESTLVAAAGVVAGIAVHLVSAPLLTFFPIQGGTPTLAQVWLPWWTIAVIALAVITIAVVSAVTGLRDVVISPLSVRRRTDRPKLSWLRVVIGGVIIVGAVGLLQMVSPGWGTLGIAAAFAVAITSVMAVLGVVGPYVIGRLASRQAKRAEGAAELIAARGILESPKTAWRQVSGVALASFVVVPAGSMLGYLDLIERSSTVLDAATRQAFDDFRTVMLAAVLVSFVLVACSVGVTQAAAVLERRELYVSLDRIGMPVSEMNRGRRLAVLSPLRVAVVGSALTATILFFWLVAIATTTAPLFMFGIAVALLTGVVIVRIAVTATTTVLNDVLAHPDRSL